MEEIVLYEKEKDIGKITLNKPEQRNSLDLITLKKLIDAFNQSSENEDVCVIYTGEGKDFCVGADLEYSYDLIHDVNKLPEAIEFLQQNIRFDTTNPPGNELILAKIIQEKFENEKNPLINTKIIETQHTSLIICNSLYPH